MPNIRRYMDFHSGDNEWLAESANGDDEEWQEAWKKLKAECTHQIEFTEDIYSNSENGDIPDWIDVTIDDAGVLPFKMARSVVNALEGARSITFNSFFDVVASPEWGGISNIRLEVYEGGAYVTLNPKYSSEEVEVNITEQFNQAIGESV